MFKRPGEVHAGAFGISFAADRDTDAGPSVFVNKNEALALQEQRKRLPIYKHRTEILYAVEHHACTILVGETGSGKTTQIPQYLLEAGWNEGGKRIACTQPRRVAAMTVAARVAEEMGCHLGQDVGYSIRFEEVSTPGTKIKYCTDGVLLREMLEDPLLSAYSVVMVDEAHERSISTDLLLGLLKKVQRRRPDLRLIIASATLEARKVAEYFNTATVRRRPRSADGGGPDPALPVAGGISLEPALMSVEGRSHIVQAHYLQEPASDYVRTAVETAVNIHREGLPGDILIFLTGQEDCERAVALLEDEARRVRKTQSQSQLRLMPAPLFAGLPATAQLSAVQPPPRGYRKIVAATNIAETSVTIEGIVYVIDCCFSKQKTYNPLTGLESLLAAPISQASASQRAGRAGRVRPGHVFRLCSEAAFLKDLPVAGVPEMQRAELAGVVLQLKALGVDNIMKFDWLAPPPAETMIRALELLHALGALDDDVRLSRPVGQQMAELPVEPRLAAALLAGGRMGCSEEVATVVAMLGVQSVWAGARNDRKALDEAKLRFAVGEGDLITYLNVWRGWEESGRSGQWAARNAVNHRTMLRAADIRSQLLRHLRRLGVTVESCGKEIVSVRKALAAGLFTNAVRLAETVYGGPDARDLGVTVYRMVRSAGPGADVRLRIGTSSVLWATKPACLLFCSVQQSASGWYEMSDLLAIEPEWLPEIAPHMYEYKKKRG